MACEKRSSIRYLDLLRQFPLFRKLFAARAISLLGDWLNLLALLALLREMDIISPHVLSALFILKLLPNFLMSPIAGILADRFSRQRIMVISDLARFGFVLCFFLAPLWPSYAEVYILSITALQAAAAAFFEPAKTALLPDLVPKSALASANGLSALTWSVAYAIGSALGGVITFLLGWRFALVLDAGSYLVSAYLVASMTLIPRRKKQPHRAGGMLLGWTDIRKGMAYIFSQAEVAYTVILKAGWSLAGAIPLVLTLYGERKYHFGDRPDIGMAFLFACRAIGTGIGPILGQRIFRQDRAGIHQAIWVSFGIGAAFYFAFGSVNNPFLAGLAIVLAHIGGSIIWVFSTVRLQQLVPSHFRGRVFAAELGLATLMISLSTWGIGLLAETWRWSLENLTYLLVGLLGFSGLGSWIIGGVWLGLGSRHQKENKKRETALKK